MKNFKEIFSMFRLAFTGMRKNMKKSILLLACMAGILAGCAEPELETVYDSSQTENLSDINILQEEQGRAVNCSFETYGEDVPDVVIQATVTVPETAVIEGEFEYSLPSVEKIEEVLTGGEKMEKGPAEYSTEVWRIKSDDGGNSIDKMQYSVSPDIYHATFFNSLVKCPVNFPYTDENCPDEETARKLQELTDLTISIYEKLGMQVKLFDRSIAKEEGKYVAQVEVVSRIEDVPLVRENYVFVSNLCSIAEDGVESMAFAGSFTPKNTQEVSVISIDQLLKIVEEEAAAGDVEAWKTITGITLAYCVDYDTRTFYPVWCLSDNIYGADICINAQTGEVVPYKRVSGF